MIELNKEESNFHDGEFFLHRLIYKGNSFLNQENEFWKLPFEGANDTIQSYIRRVRSYEIFLD